MKKRRAVKEKHEQFLVDAFIAWWSSQMGEQFRVISRPQPPEAIVQSDQRTTWVEVTDAFYSGKWAQDLYSNATPGESHEPIGPWPHTHMDAQQQCTSLLYLKRSYPNIAMQSRIRNMAPAFFLSACKVPGLTIRLAT